MPPFESCGLLINMGLFLATITQSIRGSSIANGVVASEPDTPVTFTPTLTHMPAIRGQSPRWMAVDSRTTMPVSGRGAPDGDPHHAFESPWMCGAYICIDESG